MVDALEPTTTHLTIVPDGPLHRLPFAALPDAEHERLGRRVSISRAPSLSVWHALRTRKTIQQARALAIVDPRADDATLPRLEHARAEGKALAAVVPTTLRIGEEASEAFLLGVDLRPFSIIHFGAHAVLDEAHPNRTAVMLARGSAEVDGHLRPSELATLGLDGSVVVLAACRGASGPILGGEGPMGLAHALFRGGARTVVASLWPIEDEAASLFFRRMYTELGRGVSVADAVATVRHDLEAAGVDPSGWAGIVVLGDGAFVPLVSIPRRPWGWTALAAAGVLVLVGVAVRCRRGSPER